MSQITIEKTAEDSASKSLRVTVPVDRVREAEVLAVGARTFGDLRGQLSRGRQDEGSHGAARLLPPSREALQNRKHERGRLASTGLRAREQIAPT